MKNNKYRLLTKEEIKLVEKYGLENLTVEQFKQYLFSKSFYDTTFFLKLF